MGRVANAMLLSTAALAATPAAAVAGGAGAREGPCDITGKAGNPCVAAHSTTRALYAAYDGPLYRVTYGKVCAPCVHHKGSQCCSAGNDTDIGLLEPGGFANISTQDAVCGKGDCVISLVYDQSGKNNHLGQRHMLVNASKHKIIVGDNVPVYGMWIDPGYGYHVDNTTGLATGAEEESIYAVMSGTHYNQHCCFDYGNSETNDKDDGCGTMEAIFFGNCSGDQPGPCIRADLENGMYQWGGNTTIPKVNDSTALAFPFTSLYLRGRTDGFMMKGGDATKGKLKTMWDGPRPNTRPDPKGGQCSYQPMRKQGAIILGTGGDNSNRAEGNFYEGMMVAGATSDATDDAVQANIIAVGYKE